MTCGCERAQYRDTASAAEQFGNLRQCCPALRELLLPDDAWQLAVAAEQAAPDPAYHRSYLVLAYERGCLARVTVPVHRFLLDAARVRDAVTNQYRQDLAERWLGEADGVARHERFRRFFGKIVELQLAAWIETRGWRVTGLEALGDDADIVAVSPLGRPCSFEVKYIGQESADFQQVLQALAGSMVAEPGGVYEPANYLLFRVYEAARRPWPSGRGRVVAVVISELAWRAFALPLRNHWISWGAPAFLKTDEADWHAFLKGQRTRYPDLEADMARVVPSLDQLWIMRVTGHHEYVLEHEVSGATARAASINL